MSTNSQTQSNPEPAADPATALFSFWTQWMEQSARGTEAMLEAMQAAADPQQIQRRWLDAVAQSLEDFMRTPVFLEAIKRNLKMATDLKRLQDQVLRGVARQLGPPLAAEIAGLFEPHALSGHRSAARRMPDGAPNARSVKRGDAM